MQSFNVPKINFTRRSKDNIKNNEKNETRLFVLEYFLSRKLLHNDIEIFSEKELELFCKISKSHTKNPFDASEILKVRGDVPIESNCPNLFKYLGDLRTDWLIWYESSIGTYKLNVLLERRFLCKKYSIPPDKNDRDMGQLTEEQLHFCRVHDGMRLVIESIRKQYRKFIDMFVHSIFLQVQVVLDNEYLRKFSDYLLSIDVSVHKVRTLPVELDDSKVMLSVMQNAVELSKPTIENISEQSESTLESQKAHLFLNKKRTADIVKSNKDNSSNKKVYILDRSVLMISSQSTSDDHIVVPQETDEFVSHQRDYGVSVDCTLPLCTFVSHQQDYGVSVDYCTVPLCTFVSHQQDYGVSVDCTIPLCTPFIGNVSYSTRQHIVNNEFSDSDLQCRLQPLINGIPYSITEEQHEVLISRKDSVIPNVCGLATSPLYNIDSSSDKDVFSFFTAEAPITPSLSEILAYYNFPYRLVAGEHIAVVNEEVLFGVCI